MRRAVGSMNPVGLVMPAAACPRGRRPRHAHWSPRAVQAGIEVYTSHQENLTAPGAATPDTAWQRAWERSGGGCILGEDI